MRPVGKPTFFSVSKSAASLAALFCAITGFGQQKATTPDSAERVVMCSYNLKNWLIMDRFNGREVVKSSPKPEAEKARIIAALKTIQPDILGVCEIGSEADLRELQGLLKEAGIDLPHFEVAHGGDPYRQQGLLTRFPIVSRQSQTDLYYEMGESTLPFQRGILDVGMKLPQGHVLRCVGVHLKSKREVPEGDQALMRRNEARLLRKHLDSILEQNPKQWIVAYGDFNEHRNEPPIKDIIASRASPKYMVDALIRDLDGEVWTHFWDAADSYSRFDYFFLSRALRPVIDWNRSFIYKEREFDQASDHRPIVLSIQLTDS